MQIYIFKSETRRVLHAFAGDLMGSKLPQNHGPWTVTEPGIACCASLDAFPHEFIRL